MAASLAGLIEETGLKVSVQLDKGAPNGEFAVFLDEEKIFSRMASGRLPDPQDIIQAIRTRLSATGSEEDAKSREPV